jgi:SAM-dependent methyltransferase
LNRLIEQSRFVGDISEHILRLAGLGEGMTVLDVGCGAGDLSFLAARFVGPSGSVIGVDRSDDAVLLARERAASAGLTNVSFIVADISELELDEPVDALIGRLILMYFSDPAVVVRHLARLVKPGGIVCFQDYDLYAPKSVPRVELGELTLERIQQAFIRAGADIQTGLKLGQIFKEAGLPQPQTILGGRAEFASDSPIYDQVAMITRTMLPVMEKMGIATAEEVDVDTLASRLRAETIAANATVVGPTLIGAWTRTECPPA